MVDLDGAKAAEPVNSELIFKVVKNSGLKVEVGGGIRSRETISHYIDNGVSRVILGSAALNNPALVKGAVLQYGEKIAVGIDARNGKVAAQGWTETSDVDYIELAKQMERIGAKYIIFTDISRDGTLSGPNLEMLDALNRAVTCNIIASGGVGKP
jgi:phosphoribosylformimino-5-aminoimidazole carboxamide ribotide isomerase